MQTSFKHPTTGEDVYVILDPCHMLKLARNAMAHIGSFVDDEGHLVQWKYVEELQKLQAQEGLTLGNKLSSNHLKFKKHKMNVRLAVQTLSSSVANAIAFMDQCDSTHSSRFAGSAGTVKFICSIDKLFDMLNSRNPWGKGFKAPLRLRNKEARILYNFSRISIVSKNNHRSITFHLTTQNLCYWLCNMYKINDFHGY